jgi:hypothetical protein
MVWCIVVTDFWMTIRRDAARCEGGRRSVSEIGGVAMDTGILNFV